MTATRQHRAVDTETAGTIVSPATSPQIVDPTNGTVVAILKDAYDVTITDEMLTAAGGQEVLDFKIPYASINRSRIQSELSVLVQGQYFEIRTVWDGWDTGSPIPITSVHGEARWYAELGESDPITMDRKTDPQSALRTALNGTLWSVGVVEPDGSDGGSIKITDPASPLTVVRLVPQAFGGELEFDSVNRKVHLRNQRGSSTPVALYAYGRNLQGCSRQEDTTNLVTRLYPSGTDDKGNPVTLIEDGSTYLEDNSFYASRGIPAKVRAASVSADSIKDAATLRRWGNAQLAVMSQPSYTYQIQQGNTGVNDVLPKLGDVVRVHDSELDMDLFARVQMRVINTRQPWLSAFTLDTGLYTLTSVTGGGGGGGIVGGGGGGGGSVETIPNAPTSVSVSGLLSIDGDGHTMVQIEAGWSQVTSNTDGSPITDLDHYTVQFQLTLSNDMGVSHTTSWASMDVPAGITDALLDLTGPNVTVTVRVRAVNTGGTASDWTMFGPALLAGDTHPPNAPTTPAVDATSLPGVCTVTWDGNLVGATVPPADFLRVDVHASKANGFAPSPTTLMDSLPRGGGVSALALSPGTWYFRLVAVDTALNQSSPSAQASTAVRQIVNTDLITDIVDNRLLADNAVSQANIQDAAIGTAEIIDAAIVTAKIGSLAVNDAQIGSMNVGKLQAGTLTADVVMGARIKTANSGLRAEMNGTGFYLYDSQGFAWFSASLSGGQASVNIIGNINAGSTLPMTAYTDNNLPNGSMEDVAPNGTLPSNWAQAPGPVGVVTVGMDTTNPVSGARSLVMTAKGNTAGVGVYNTATVGSAPLDRWVMKADIRISGNTLGGNSVILRAAFYDVNGNQVTATPAAPTSAQITSVSGNYYDTPSTYVGPGYADIAHVYNAWNVNNGVYRFLGEVQAPAGTAYIRVYIYNWTSNINSTATTTMTVDNVYLARSGIGNAVRQGYITGSWLRTAEAGKRIEIGQASGYNIEYFYTGWMNSDNYIEIAPAPFYLVSYSQPQAGFIAVDAVNSTGNSGSTPVNDSVGGMMLQAPKLDSRASTIAPYIQLLSAVQPGTQSNTQYDKYSGLIVINPGNVQDYEFRVYMQTATGGVGSRGDIQIGSSINNVSMLFTGAGSPSEVRVINYAGTTYHPIRASAFPTGSSARLKTVSKRLPKGMALDAVMYAPSRTWKYKPPAEGTGGDDRLHVFPHLEDLPSEVWHDDEAVDPRDVVGLLWEAVRELGGDVEHLREMIKA